MGEEMPSGEIGRLVGQPTSLYNRMNATTQSRKTDTDDDEPTIEHGDTIESTDEANEAVLNQGMVLRVQPGAPDPTQFVWHDPRGAWLRETHRVRGEQSWTPTNAEHIRSLIGDRLATGNVRALGPDECDEDFGSWEVRK